MDGHALAARGEPAGAAVRLSQARDERLARLVGSGSERAFAALYERYRAVLYRYAYSIVRHEADAQDVLQATFAAAYVALRADRRDAPLRPWLFRIAHNHAITLLRQRRPVNEISEDLVAAGSEVETRAAERERMRELVADLRELSERQRSALVMRELGGLSHEEIALVLDSSVAAAKQTIFEARQTLAEYMEGRAMSCDEVCRSVSDGDRRALRSRRVRAHLRECSGCAAFAEAIPARYGALRALAPPLPAAAAAAILRRVTGSASPAGGGCGPAPGMGAKVAGTAMGAKVAAGLAVVSATVGAAAILNANRPSSRSSKPVPAAVASTRAAAVSRGHVRAITPTPTLPARAGSALSGSPFVGSKLGERHGAERVKRPSTVAKSGRPAAVAGGQVSSTAVAGGSPRASNGHPGGRASTASGAGAFARGRGQAAVSPGHNKTAAAPGRGGTSAAGARAGAGTPSSHPGASRATTSVPGPARLLGTPVPAPGAGAPRFAPSVTAAPHGARAARVPVAPA